MSVACHAKVDIALEQIPFYINQNAVYLNFLI